MPVKNPNEPFQRITIQEAREMMEQPDIAVVDVRDPHEYESGHVPGAQLLPVKTLMERHNELPKGKQIIFVCGVGQRSALACEMAAALGYSGLYNLEGGTEAWKKAGLPVE